MSLLSAEQVAGAISSAGLAALSSREASLLAQYGNLLIKWNSHTNLTAIADAPGVLQRHVVECVAAAQALPAGMATLLDYGTGAGLPGIPIAICRPEIKVTLAESQAKKVAFLREALRTLELSAEIFHGRVDTMERGRRFALVSMRAVDRMELAVVAGGSRVDEGGWLVLFVTKDSEQKMLQRIDAGEFYRVGLPTLGELIMVKPAIVPRGTAW